MCGYRIPSVTLSRSYGQGMARYSGLLRWGEPEGMAFDGENIWVANRSSNTVTKLKAVDGQVVGTFRIGGGISPNGVAYDGANIWVTNYGSGNVTKLRRTDGVVQGIFAVGSGP